MNICLEIGTSTNPEMEYLLNSDWNKINDQRLANFQLDRSLPAEMFASNTNWECHFVEGDANEIGGLFNRLLKHHDDKRFYLYNAVIHMPANAVRKWVKWDFHGPSHEDPTWHVFPLSLNQFLEYSEIEKVDVMRVDIEGAEHVIFFERPIILPKLLIIETHFADRKQELENQIRSFGYETKWCDDLDNPAENNQTVLHGILL